MHGRHGKVRLPMMRPRGGFSLRTAILRREVMLAPSARVRHFGAVHPRDKKVRLAGAVRRDGSFRLSVRVRRAAVVHRVGMVLHEERVRRLDGSFRLSARVRHFAVVHRVAMVLHDGRVRRSVRVRHDRLESVLRGSVRRGNLVDFRPAAPRLGRNLF
jgi:hypothetical protein